jgi:hypothetical protein
MATAEPIVHVFVLGLERFGVPAFPQFAVGRGVTGDAAPVMSTDSDYALRKRILTYIFSL